jgi:hypothetical protein
MKFLLTTLLLPAAIAASRAQSHTLADSILNHRVIAIPAYEIPETGVENLVLPMNYGKSQFTDTTGLCHLHDAQILSVDLLYSDFPPATNLKPLNKSRLQELCRLVPGIDQQPGISWNIVRQTSGYDKTSAEKLVHGFVINYRSPYTEEEAREETALITAATPPPPATPTQPKRINHWEIIHRTGDRTPIVYENRTVRQTSHARKFLEPYITDDDTVIAITTEEAYRKKLLVPRGSKLAKPDSLFLLTERLNKPKAKPMDTPPLPPLNVADSTVLNSFTRNHFSNALVIIDVTGSMSPYIVQLLHWLTTQQERHTMDYLVCFNDGDKTQDKKKIINQTGGIYGSKTESVREASQLVLKTINKGNGGGDLQENVCEAILYGMREASAGKDIVLIADSWAPVRDTALIASIHRPVHIMVCGKRLGIHTDYIRLALATGGSLHFEKEDILSLEPLNRGEKMVINKITYYLHNGRVNREF